jgi:hypothetical protein
VGELLEAAANVGLVVLIVALLAALGYQWFGAQVLGLPAMIAVFAFAAFATNLGELGSVGLITAVLAVVAVFLVIGIAMTYGDERPPRRRP